MWSSLGWIWRNLNARRSVHRTDHTDGTEEFLEGHRAFRSLTGGKFKPLYSTERHPIQDFGWSDYRAKPGHKYTYTVTALKGGVDNPQPYAAVNVEVETEDPSGGRHDLLQPWRPRVTTVRGGVQEPSPERGRAPRLQMALQGPL